MRKAIYLITLALAAACACQKTGEGIPEEWPWNDPDADDKPFVEVTDDSFGTLPDGIRLYKSPEVLQGKPAIAYIATVDLSKHGFHVWGIKDPVLTGSTDALQTPTEVYNKKDSPVLVMNGDVVMATVIASISEAIWIAAYDVPRLRMLVKIGAPDFSPKVQGKILRRHHGGLLDLLGRCRQPLDLRCPRPERVRQHSRGPA